LYDVLVFYKSYKDALEAYQGAAESSTPQVPDEQQQQRQQQVQQTAGKAIKQFLKDLWSSFVIIVGVTRSAVLYSLMAIVLSDCSQLL
jgi:hypothetical protein